MVRLVSSLELEQAIVDILASLTVPTLHRNVKVVDADDDGNPRFPALGHHLFRNQSERKTVAVAR